MTLPLGTSIAESANLEPVVHVHLGPPDSLVAAISDPTPAEPFLHEFEYVVIDVETTGSSVRAGDRVTEIAAICVDARGRIVEEMQTLVNPCRPIPQFITSITNITDEMVRGAPRFEEIAPELIRMLENRVFVAHNASFDFGFVGAELVFSTGYVLDARVLCTLRLARKVVPEVSRRSLDALSYYFGIENDARHRAYGDALATATLFAKLMERLEEREVQNWSALEELLTKRKPRRKRQANPQSMEWA